MASMNLCEWASNSQQEFITLLSQENKASNISNTHKMLGINWNLITDELSVSKPILNMFQLMRSVTSSCINF